MSITKEYLVISSAGPLPAVGSPPHGHRCCRGPGVCLLSASLCPGAWDKPPVATASPVAAATGKPRLPRPTVNLSDVEIRGQSRDEATSGSETEKKEAAPASQRSRHRVDPSRHQVAQPAHVGLLCYLVRFGDRRSLCRGTVHRPAAEQDTALRFGRRAAGFGQPQGRVRPSPRPAALQAVSIVDGQRWSEPCSPRWGVRSPEIGTGHERGPAEQEATRLYSNVRVQNLAFNVAPCSAWRAPCTA